MVKVSDLESQPEEGEANAEQKPRKWPRVTIEGDPGAVLGQFQKQLVSSPAMKSLNQATAALAAAQMKLFSEATASMIAGEMKPLGEGMASMIAAQMKPLNEALTKLGTSGLIGRQSAIADAFKAANKARDILDQVDVVPKTTPIPDAYFRGEAQRRAAPIATLEAVRSLADAVDSLAESTQRSSSTLVGLTFALAVMTAMVVILTLLLVLHG